MKMRPLSAAVALLLAGFAASVQADDLRRPYIVQLADKPVSSYTGEIAGLPATQPAPGARLDVDSTDVQLYSDYLGQKQQIVRASIADAPVLYNYSVVLNGFAALLTDDEVRALQLRSDVAAITPDTPRQVTTTYTSRSWAWTSPTACGPGWAARPKPAKTSSSASSTAVSGRRTPPMPTASTPTASRPSTTTAPWPTTRRRRAGKASASRAKASPSPPVTTS